jgi:O-antigen ligase
MAFFSLFTPYTRVNSLSDSLAQTFHLILVFIFIRLMFELKWDSPLDAIKEFFSGLFWGNFFFSIIALIVVGPEAQMGALGNERYLHPGVIGLHSGIAALLAYSRFRSLKKRRLFYLVGFIILSILTLMTLNKTSIVGLVVTVIFISIIIAHRTFKLKELILALLAIAIVALPLLDKLEEMYIKYISNTSERGAYTLSGRLILWQVALSFIRENLWLGYGYGAASDWLIEYIPWKVSWALHTHNDLLNSLLEVGIMGTVFLFIVIIRTGILLVRLAFSRYFDSDLSAIILQMLSVYLFSLLYSLTIAFFAYFGIGFILLCFLSLSTDLLWIKLGKEHRVIRSFQ